MRVLLCCGHSGIRVLWHRGVMVVRVLGYSGIVAFGCYGVMVLVYPGDIVSGS